QCDFLADAARRARHDRGLAIQIAHDQCLVKREKLQSLWGNATIGCLAGTRHQCASVDDFMR
ncbi:hypothetical protein, partial [Burkholderia alba]|uniref:hypothetical protein n=1 Tax=Burkholderia alba TaxID=2683677 RepID=UPI002B061AA6